MSALVSLLLPPRCPGCGETVGEDHAFCAACWADLRFIAPPWCEGCNIPFAHHRPAGVRCARCIGDPPRHAGIRAAVGYGETARRLALSLKYGGRLGRARTMARRIAPLVPADLDLLVPVPLHRWRLWRRGFNQAGLIAAALARACSLPVDHRALVRHRATDSLRGLGRRRRSEAVRAAFRVDRPDAVRGRAIGLVDDVLASGATADACVRTLLRAGAASVTILCWARVLSDDPP